MLPKLIMKEKSNIDKISSLNRHIAELGIQSSLGHNC
jgi:hypothetical protein